MDIKEDVKDYLNFLKSKVPRVNNFSKKLSNFIIFLLGFTILVEFLKLPSLNYQRLYLLYLMMLSSKLTQIYLEIKDK